MIQIHECLDGPFEGYTVTWLAGESRIRVRDLDGSLPPEWYEMVEGDDAGLHWVQNAAPLED